MKEKIKKILQEAELTQRDLAEILGVNHAVISRLLSSCAFGRKSAKLWEEAFGFRQGWLLTGEGEMFTSDHPKIFDYKKGGDNYGKVSSSKGNATGVVNGNADMRTYNAEKIIRENGDTELYNDTQEVINRLEIENAAQKQRIQDLELLLAAKEETICTLKECIRLLNSK